MASTENNNNTTTIVNIADDWQCPWDSTKTSLIFCYFLILLIGTCGNILVLALFKRKLHQSVLNLLIMYLAAFDLFASFFVPFIFGYWVWTCDLEWTFGLFGCKVLPTATRIFTSVSVGILLIMAIERCRVIISPFKPPLSRKSIHLAVLATVILACLSETHYVMVLHINEDGQCAVVGSKEYIYPSITITLFRTIAFSAIFASTTVIVTCKLKTKSEVDDENDMRRHVRLRVRRKKKAMKMLVVMMVVFGVTVIPRDLFQISLVISYLLPRQYWIDYSPTLLLINTILKILQTSNSIYNVFIYAGMYKGFVANSLKLCKRVKKLNLNQYSIRRRGRLTTETTDLNFLAPKSALAGRATNGSSRSSTEDVWI